MVDVLLQDSSDDGCAITRQMVDVLLQDNDGWVIWTDEQHHQGQ
jgi:hypothetical protein